MTHKEEMGGTDKSNNFGCLTLIIVGIVAVLFTLIFFFGKNRII